MKRTCLPVRFAVFLGFFAGIAAYCALPAIGAPSEPTAKPRSTPKHAPAPSLADVAVGELIDRLQKEGEPGIGTHSTAWTSGFLPVDAVPKFRGGILGSAPPKRSPVMTELVRRGVAALPLLLEHLTDARPTRLIVGDGFSGRWYSDEYDPRYSDPQKWPPGINKQGFGGFGSNGFKYHTLKVGDLCYVAVGQIVNRGLSPVRYQPSMCLVVNSPLQNRALAEAARKDWSGLTPAEHELSLRTDILTSTQGWDIPAALKRLTFYYPAVGRPLTIRLLNRPLIDSAVVSEFFWGRLVRAGPEKWHTLLVEFRKRSGKVAYGGLQQEILFLSDFPDSQLNPERARAKEVARRLLAEHFPHLKSQELYFIDAVEPDDQQELVDDLPTESWPELEAALYRLYQRTVATRPSEISDHLHRGDLALACAQRLLKKGYDEEFRTFFTERVRWAREALAAAKKEEPSLPRGSAGYGPALQQRIDFYKQFLGKLSQRRDRKGKS